MIDDVGEFRGRSGHLISPTMQMLLCSNVAAEYSVTTTAPFRLSTGQSDRPSKIAPTSSRSRSFDLLQATVMSDDASLEKSAPACTLRKGLLWQQRDKIFSRWKERFFVLTPDYLNCFKRGTSRMSEMGEFLFKVSAIMFDPSPKDTLILT